MENVKNKPLAEGNAKSLDRMPTDNACPMHHVAARRISPFSTASHSSRHCEGYAMKSPARERLRGIKQIIEGRQVELSKTRREVSPSEYKHGKGKQNTEDRNEQQ